MNDVIKGQFFVVQLSLKSQALLLGWATAIVTIAQLGTELLSMLSAFGPAVAPQLPRETII